VSTTEPVPARFRGAWTRVSLAVDGAPPSEHADVVWLQTERDYADLRVPHLGYGDIVAPMSFAGTTTWTDPFLRWGHHLDLDPGRGPGDADVGRVRWAGDDLVETGEFADGGRRVAYEEVWRRLPNAGGGAECLWSDERTCVTVRVGDHALTIADERAGGGHFRACYRIRHDGSWCVELALGADAADLPVPPTDTTDPAMGVPTR
jgi:hypothetical protein